jgi:tape measure domain-containing protein
VIGRGGGFEVGSVYYTIGVDTAPLLAASNTVDRESQRMAGRFNIITSAIAAMSSALFLVARSDAFTKINAQLKLATDSAQAQANAFDRVRRIAAESQTDLGGVATLYARISQSSEELRGNQERVGEITRVVALALKVSGAGAAESASATLQLSQAFASGALRGEEFNSVSEAAPRLMKALADGIGVPVGQLRAMAAEGQLTADVLSNALPQALSQLESEAQSIQTISGAFQVLRNELTIFIGQQGEASGAAKLVAASISTIAANIDLLAAAVAGFAATKLAQILVSVAQTAAAQASQALSAGAAAAAELRLAQAQAAAAAAALAEAQAQRALGQTHIQTAALATAHQAAVTRLAAAQTAAAAAAGIASRALGILGGPIGLITTLLGLGVSAWALWGGGAQDASEQAAGAVRQSTDEIIESLDRQIAKLRDRNAVAAAGLGNIAKQESAAAARLAELQGQINNLQAGRGPAGEANFPEAARIPLLQTLLRQYAELAGKIGEAEAEKAKLEGTGQSARLSEWLRKYATDAEKLAAELKKAKDELGPAFTPEIEQRIRQRFMPAKTADAAKPQGGAGDDVLEQIRQQTAAEAKLAQIESDRIRLADERAAKEAEAEERARRSREQGQQFAAGLAVGDDPIARLQFELEQKSALLQKYAAIDQQNAALYNAAKVQLETDTATRITEILAGQEEKRFALQSQTLNAYGSLFGSLADISKSFAGEQSGIYKAMFVASKAFAIADAILKIQQGIANAAALPYPANIGAMASVAAATGSIISTMQGVNYGGGRQFGGPVSAGSMYRVNETGAPEMFVGSGGKQFMLPTSSGQVVPADEVGGGSGGWTLIVEKLPAGLDIRPAGVDNERRIVRLAVAEVAGQFRENSGEAWNALAGSSNVRGRF